MKVTQSLHLTIQIALDEPDNEVLDSLARQLMDELSDQPVESVDLARSESAPAGTKSAEAITLGALAITVLPGVLPKLIEFCQAWALRGRDAPPAVQWLDLHRPGGGGVARHPAGAVPG